MVDDTEGKFGVGEPAGTVEPAKPEVPEKVTPTAKPTPKVNLDELPEFRKYKAESDRKIAEREKALAETQRREAEAQRKAQEIQTQVAQLQYAVDTAGKDDFEKAQVDLTYAKRQQAALQAQLAQANQEINNRQLAEQAQKDKATYIAGRVQTFKEEYGYDVPKNILEDANSQAEVEAKIAKFVMERNKEILRKREDADNVDIGAGAPVSASAEDKRDWERATHSGDMMSAIDIVFNRAAKKQ